MNFEERKQKYAELIAKRGVNLQKGDGVLINANLEGLEMAKLVITEAYKLGVKHVEFNLTDDELSLIRYEYGTEEAFQGVPKWKVDSIENMYKDGYSVIRIVAPNPELLKNVDSELVAKDVKASSLSTMPIQKYLMAGLNKWSIAAVPSKAWAKIVFPDLSIEDGIEKLWENIFLTARITDDPIKAWDDHTNNLKKYLKYLNEHQFDKFRYIAPGTDLEVYMPDNHIWEGGSAYHEASKTEYLPNIPTEEVFSMPHRDKINGTLKSTKPLSVRGKIVDGFGFTFENGKIVDFYAETGYDTLEKLLNTDEGARHLGEIALVPDDSPISNTNLLFNNTLFDENASCHFALGRAYPTCIENGTKMNPEELLKVGGNNSLIHVDFMVGSKDLTILAYKDDKEYEIFKNGNWTF